MDQPPPTSRRAWPWILAPLALALLYWVLFPLFAPEPTLADVVPGDAVFTHRFKNLAAMDAAWFRHPDDPGRPSVHEAARRNLGGLPGVDPQRPIHLVLLRREQRPDPSMLILPVADADALRARFDDPTFFLERGYVRHAQHLAIRGDWAGVGGDRDVVRRLGDGGLTARDLGEDHAIAADVPELIRYMLAAPMELPWRQVLHALGFAPDVTGAAEEVPGAVIILAERVLRVHDTWREARLWSWIEAGRIRLDLEPAPGTVLADRLAALGPVAAPSAVPTAPPRAQAWLRMEDAARRAALAWALYGAGIVFPAGLRAADDAPLGAWGEAQGSGLLVWASPSVGTGYAWTLGLAAPGDGLPPLAPFHARVPDQIGEADVEAGELVLTLADLQLDRVAPAGRILRRRVGDLDLVVLGAAAEETWRRFETWQARGETRRSRLPAPKSGWRVVATFGLVEVRARTLLGNELKRGGLLRALAGGAIEGRVLTNGTTLRVEAQVVRD